MTIQCDTIAELTEIVAGLVKQGLTFKAFPKSGGWEIELLGGF